MTRSLPPLLCGHCGALDVPLIGPGTSVHVARALCSGCGRFLRWLPKALFDGEKDKPTMESVNVCVLSGTLERDPALRFRDDGSPHCTATIRLEEGRDGTLYKTYVLAEAFGKTAEVLADLHGGAVVIVQGKLFWRKQVSPSGTDRSGLACLTGSTN
jgi:hypothetical protein